MNLHFMSDSFSIDIIDSNNNNLCSLNILKFMYIRVPTTDKI